MWSSVALRSTPTNPRAGIWEIPDQGPACDPGAGRERRRHRHRRRAGAAIFKMESHNHPSFIEPLSGRGDRRGRHPARCVHDGRAADRAGERAALWRSEHPKTRTWWRASLAASAATATAWACRRSAARRSSTRAITATSSSTRWRWASRIPTRFSIRAAPGRGTMRSVYVGSKTGPRRHSRRDDGVGRIHEGDEEKRPTVQVGDPFTEKLLLEACLELMATDAIVAIQDMGAAGLTSSSSRWRTRAARVETGPRQGAAARDGHDGLRDHAVGKPGAHAHGAEARREAEAKKIFDKWDLDFAEVDRLHHEHRPLRAEAAGHCGVRYSGGAPLNRRTRRTMTGRGIRRSRRRR
jgi:hypothetical protein